MYRFACRDVGVNCSYVTTGKSVEEVKNQAFAHAGVVHADLLKGLSKEEMTKMTGAVEASIKFV